MTKLCPETGDPCYRMCLTMCHIISEDRVALRAEVERLRAALTLIAAPWRPGICNLSREDCAEVASDALRPVTSPGASHG
jgi:hypothetical protein